MEATITQNGALYRLQHRMTDERRVFPRRLGLAATKQPPRRMMRISGRLSGRVALIAADKKYDASSGTVVSAPMKRRTAVDKEMVKSI
ncbi:MAG TPA: hypothetical protein VGI60_14700 [Chthoniobacterales bacterium]|jgi:hypothetical protein